MLISIHAPARGATYTPTNTAKGFFKFQSTLPQGERQHFALKLYECDNFNPRSRKGSDHLLLIVLYWINIFQSTLPQGERRISTFAFGDGYSFQSTLPQGERRRVDIFSARCKLFQSTLPQGERLHLHNFYQLPHYFNPRSRKGSDERRRNKDLVQMYISIHAPARGATLSPVLVRAKDIFQSTLPQGERREFLEVPEGGELFQSTLPQGERPRINHSNLCYMIISIHAPARGATTFLLRTRRYFIISIHAPARGATQLQELRQDLIDYFNPRSRKGSDGSRKRDIEKAIKFQSTLPQGERPTATLLMLTWSDFNPRSRKGSDSAYRTTSSQLHLFQSTLPQGERHILYLEHKIRLRFQSTLPQGERLITVPIPSNTFKFQSTLPQGERRCKMREIEQILEISIHAPARGATGGRSQHVSVHHISIHAPARGATSCERKSLSTVTISIHAPARGATIWRRRDWTSSWISIHAPARGATVW